MFQIEIGVLQIHHLPTHSQFNWGIWGNIESVCNLNIYARPFSVQTHATHTNAHAPFVQDNQNEKLRS